MTLQDFLAASPGDERLAWARWLYYQATEKDSRKLQSHPGRPANAPTHAEYVSRIPASYLSGFDNGRPAFDWFDVADAVLAELARQREEAWQGGYEQGRDSER